MNLQGKKVSNSTDNLNLKSMHQRKEKRLNSFLKNNNFNPQSFQITPTNITANQDGQISATDIGKGN
jgi:hypothetical protein